MPLLICIALLVNWRICFSSAVGSTVFVRDMTSDW